MSVRRLPFVPLAVALLLAPALAGAAAAQEARPLSLGQTLQGTLATGTVHDYTVTLAAGTFLLGQVDQLTVDAVVTLLGPDGEEVAEFDSPARGPEFFQLSSESAGSYRIRVAPFEEEEGDYTISLLRLEPVAQDPAGKVDQMMAAWAGEETPGVVVGVVEQGELVFARGYGMANLEYGIPFTPEVASNIGSVTKHFTAMGVLLLEQDGKLSLEDDIRTHIPELPDFGTPVTLRNLLNHTGGYREIYNHLSLTGRDGEDLIRREEAIRVVQHQPDLQAAPNTVFNYNNTGYILLATVIERVSGETFPDFMRERVFAPLGMDRTRVKYVQGEIIPMSARGYVRSEDGYRAVRDLGGSAGAGGIYTTMGDMHRWFVNWKEGTVGGPAAYRAITTEAVLADGDSTGYGLGMGVTEIGGRTLYTHTGGDVAHRTYFAYLPELEAGVFVSSNNGSFSLGVGREIIEAFFGDDLEAEAEDGEEEEGGDQMPPERMESLAGEWVLQAGPNRLPVELTFQDGQLHAEPQGQSRFRILTTSDSTGAYQGVEATVVFHFGPDGTSDSATHHQGGSSASMVRVGAEEEDDATEPPVLEDYTGRYFSEELELVVHLAVSEEGGLVLALPNGVEMELSHQEGEVFTGGFPYQTVEFQRAGNGTITGFEAGNGRTVGVVFRRW